MKEQGWKKTREFRPDMPIKFREKVFVGGRKKQVQIGVIEVRGKVTSVRKNLDNKITDIQVKDSNNKKRKFVDIQVESTLILDGNPPPCYSYEVGKEITRPLNVLRRCKPKMKTSDLTH